MYKSLSFLLIFSYKISEEIAEWPFYRTSLAGWLILYRVNKQAIADVFKRTNEK